MSEMGEYWNEEREAFKERRDLRLEEAPKALAAAGIEYVRRNYGAHFIIRHAGLVVDFWPSRGKWAVRGGRRGHRIQPLVALLLSAAREASAPAGPAGPSGDPASAPPTSAPPAESVG